MESVCILSAPLVSELANHIVPGRQCGSCSLCCKVFAVPDFHKPRSLLCAHCLPGGGCGIHTTRPGICREFFCNWLLLDNLGPEWKPDACHFVLQSVVYPGGHQGLGIHVDPDFAESWRCEPYYSGIKSWAQKAARQVDGPIYFVLLQIGQRKWLVLPDREVDLGIFDDSDNLTVERRVTALGAALSAVKHVTRDATEGDRSRFA